MARLSAFSPPVALFAALVSAPTFASDGVVEINQACAAQTGCFAGDTAGFPITISASGSYRLTSNLLIANENTDGIVVAVEDVALDLSGFDIRGPVVCNGAPLACTPASGSGFGVKASSTSLRGISIQNGIVRGMGSTGVVLGAKAQATNLRLISNRATGIFAGEGSIILNCIASENGTNGISVGIGSTVSGSVAFNNGSLGIFADKGSTVSGNSAYTNGSNGINVVDGSTVSGNAAYKNLDSGIFAGDGSTISGNTAYDNSNVGIASGSGSNAVGNTVRLNDGAGMFLGAQSGYRENVITGNTGGTVAGSSLVNLGNNACNGLATCP